ncbi:hypothetical protein IMCC12053_886 [Celeribacter marinus]|uniref:Uncharacterized protein n=1 Tax=Celeribacter marinus TaxID=1397108 RepID=A0A0P0A393_9RHOB|nr:hypothetical protein IMCC12053_886 [Celeribacter marinus]
MRSLEHEKHARLVEALVWAVTGYGITHVGGRFYYQFRTT